MTVPFGSYTDATYYINAERIHVQLYVYHIFIKMT